MIQIIFCIVLHIIKVNSITVFAENSNGSFCQKDFQDALKPFDENKWCFGSHLKLQDPPGPVTGLWSFPGSGNTWLRYLIQKATGLITGSVYQERTRYPNFPGFPGGDVSNGSAIVVKSHLFDKNLEMFEKGILIIRNPLDCFIAEYNRVLQNNFEYAPLRKWNEIENVDDFFYNYMFPKWMELHNNIIKNFKNPLHVVEYESLKKDPIRTLFKILVFLNIEMTEGMRKCLSVGHDGPFRRPKRPQEEIDAILAKFSKENINIYERSYVDIMTKLFSLDSVSSSTLN